MSLWWYHTIVSTIWKQAILLSDCRSVVLFTVNTVLTCFMCVSHAQKTILFSFQYQLLHYLLMWRYIFECIIYVYSIFAFYFHKHTQRPLFVLQQNNCCELIHMNSVRCIWELQWISYIQHLMLYIENDQTSSKFTQVKLKVKFQTKLWWK